MRPSSWSPLVRTQSPPSRIPFERTARRGACHASRSCADADGVFCLVFCFPLVRSGRRAQRPPLTLMLLLIRSRRKRTIAAHRTRTSRVPAAPEDATASGGAMRRYATGDRHVMR